MDITKLKIGHKVLLQSGPYFTEVTVTGFSRSHLDVEIVENEKNRFLTFRINGKPGTVFERLNNLQWWQEEGPVGTEFGPWTLAPI